MTAHSDNFLAEFLYHCSRNPTTMKAKHLLILIVTLLVVSCTKPTEHAEIDIKIGYEINGKPLITDTLCYFNEAGNKFMITEIQWFISRIELQNERGDWLHIDHKEVGQTSNTTNEVFYIDTNLPESHRLDMSPIPIGKYKVMRFVFGLNEEDNQTGLFTDSPEADMFWPDALGGGYHYMKLNGKFVDEENRLAPLAIHLGIGQNDGCIEFYQNYFIVELPIDFTVAQNSENRLDLTMVVDNWFRTPNLYDFNEFGSHIMQNQTAQRLLKGNGEDVFRIGQTTEKQNNMEMKKGEKLVEKFNGIMQKAAPKPDFWNWESVRERVKKFRVES